MWKKKALLKSNQMLDSICLLLDSQNCKSYFSAPVSASVTHLALICHTGEIIIIYKINVDFITWCLQWSLQMTNPKPFKTPFLKNCHSFPTLKHPQLCLLTAWGASVLRMMLTENFTKYMAIRMGKIHLEWATIIFTLKEISLQHRLSVSKETFIHLLNTPPCLFFFF